MGSKISGLGAVSGICTDTAQFPLEDTATTNARASRAQILGFYSVKDYGAKGDNSTDDTAAIQATINAAASAGGGTVFFPTGIYVVGGALVHTNQGNSQLYLPQPAYTADKITLTLRGPYNTSSYTGSQTAAQAKGAIIRSTLTGCTFDNTFGTPSLLGGPTLTQVSTGSFTSYANLALEIVDLIFRCPANPSLGALNLTDVATAILHRVHIDTNDTPNNITLATHTTGLGLSMPALNNNGRSVANDVGIFGYYGGFGFGEHTCGDGITSCSNYVALYPVSQSYHGIQLGYVLTEDNAYVICGINPSSGVIDQSATPILTPITINFLDIEDAPSGAFVPIKHIRDGNNAFVGFIRYHRVLGGTGLQTGALTTTGCTGLGLWDLARGPLAAITPPSGGATIDSQARTAIGTIITALQKAGITL